MKEHYITALAAHGNFISGACRCGFVFTYRITTWVPQYAAHRDGKE